MSASSVFNLTSGQGGLASENSLVQDAGFIMSYVAAAQPREFCKEADLGFKPSTLDM